MRSQIEHPKVFSDILFYLSPFSVSVSVELDLKIFANVFCDLFPALFGERGVPIQAVLVQCEDSSDGITSVEIWAVLSIKVISYFEVYIRRITYGITVHP